MGCSPLELCHGLWKRIVETMSRVLIPLMFMAIFITGHNYLKLAEHHCIVKDGDRLPFEYAESPNNLQEDHEMLGNQGPRYNSGYPTEESLAQFLKSHKDYTNVSELAGMLMLAGAVLMGVLAFGGMLLQFTLDAKTDKFTQTTLLGRKNRLDALVLLVTLFQSGSTIALRYSNAGSVCSGDFLHTLNDMEALHYYCLTFRQFGLFMPVVLLTVLPLLFSVECSQLAALETEQEAMVAYHQLEQDQQANDPLNELGSLHSDAENGERLAMIKLKHLLFLRSQQQHQPETFEEEKLLLISQLKP